MFQYQLAENIFGETVLIIKIDKGRDICLLMEPESGVLYEIDIQEFNKYFYLRDQYLDADIL